MDKFAEWLVRHPGTVAVFVAVAGGWSAYNAYKIGMAHAGLRAHFADHARTASEALGG
jgi:hypothetical protein